MKIAIVGIRGIPNSYGGFETLAEYLAIYLASEVEMTVFCSSKDMKSDLKQYNGATLKYVAVTSHGAMGMIYDSICIAKAVKSHDRVLILGFGAGFIMPLLKKYRKKIILNLGGLDWKRNKWSSFAQQVIKYSEQLLVKYSNQIVSDNTGIQKYLIEEYGRESELIAYGGDQATKVHIDESDKEKYPFLSSDYAFAVTRIQKDNNIDMIIEGFIPNNNIPLVIVGNWNNSEYGIKTKAKYENMKNVYLLDAIYDQVKLDKLRSNCTIYLHGHSAGGTNPSLVEAMNLGLPIFCYASGYNEYTTQNKAVYFKNSNDLSQIIQKYENYDLEKMGEDLQIIALKNYTWSEVTAKYKSVFLAEN